MTAPELLDGRTVEQLSAEIVRFLETGTPAGGLFTDDVFGDLSLPTWRVQTRGVKELVEVRRAGRHSGPSKVLGWRSNPTDRGLVFEFDEQWEEDGEQWYARELLLMEVRDGHISSVSVYCTGDWDRARREQHRREVTLIRP